MHRNTAAFVRWIAFSWIFGVLASCRAPELPVTEIVASVQSDLRDLRSVRIEVTAEPFVASDGVISSQLQSFTEHVPAFPIVQPIVLSNDMVSRRVRITVTAEDGREGTFAIAVVVPFQVHEVIEVPIFLASGCGDAAVRRNCLAQNRVCGAGAQCVPVIVSVVDPATGNSAPVDGGEIAVMSVDPADAAVVDADATSEAGSEGGGLDVVDAGDAGDAPDSANAVGADAGDARDGADGFDGEAMADADASDAHDGADASDADAAETGDADAAVAMCPSGQMGTPPNCVAVDACATANGGCDALTTCTSNGGVRTCGACPSGYTGSGASGCTDVDECASGNGGCDALTTCANTAGSRTCGACPSGFTGTGASGCVDIDEYVTGNGGCDALTMCANTAGSRTCGACPSGYTGSGASGCTDVNECASGNGGCDPLTTCANTAGSRTCSACPSGYTGNGTSGCADVNECASGNGGCDALTTCTNIAGSRTCSACPSGYAGNGASGCTDVDECASGNGGCDALTTCANTPGSRTCGACPSGYTGGGATGCVDLNECASGNGGCDALTTCTNTPGSRTCGACPSGYTGTGASGCVDVNECATNNGGCDALTTCTNTAGSRTCGACPGGYAGTGATGCTGCPVGMMLIPAGTFQMGSANSDTAAGSAERPVHSVTLSAFCMDQTEVTVAMYRVCLGCSAPDIRSYCNWTASAGGRENHPINCIDWDQARVYCESRGARMPTEAEWEYTARGTDERIYPWGNDAPTCSRLNWNSTSCVGGTAPVGSYPSGRSFFGLDDMAGNVAEWVSDWYGAYSSADSTNPTGPTSGNSHVERGGGWNSDVASGVRAAFRDTDALAYRGFGLGVRCARGAR